MNAILENVETNSLGVEVKRPDQILIIMRGIPGSGKSTAARKLVELGVIHSTDDLIEAMGDYRAYFQEMVKSGDFSKHSRTHSRNLANAKMSLDEGYSPVIIDNTNLKANEPKEYVKYALSIGLADENIKIVDIGTAGLSAEELAERNTHGVPLDKIKQMMESHKSTGELTVKKILEAKDMYKQSDILYSAVVLGTFSKHKLLDNFIHEIPENWNKIAHHMTIAFGKAVPNKEDIGKEVILTVTHLGVSDMAIAARVEGYATNNKIPHITLAVNPEGGKPVMSNDITDWKPVRRTFCISGVVTEVKKNV